MKSANNIIHAIKQQTSVTKSNFAMQVWAEVTESQNSSGWKRPSKAT